MKKIFKKKKSFPFACKDNIDKTIFKNKWVSRLFNFW